MSKVRILGENKSYNLIKMCMCVDMWMAYGWAYDTPFVFPLLFVFGHGYIFFSFFPSWLMSLEENGRLVMKTFVTK
jgi:hypothetical protein